MKIVTVKIGKTYMDSKTLKLRRVTGVAFGTVIYDMYIKELSVWVRQSIGHKTFKEKISSNVWVEYLGENPPVKLQEELV